jgi:hypothetical protein
MPSAPVRRQPASAPDTPEPAVPSPRDGEFPDNDSAWDTQQAIGAWAGAGGLLVLGLSPFFNWITFGAGGRTGLAGDGKIILAFTLLAAAAYGAAVFTRARLGWVLLAVQAWGTIAAFWMASLIWRISSLVSSPEAADNAFAALLASQVGPGAGLYMGLIGGLAVAGALGFVAVRLLLPEQRLLRFYISQTVACALGILVAVVVGPDDTDGSPDASPAATANARDNDTGESAEKAERTAYIAEHLELYDFEAKQIESVLNGEMPGVLFKLRNTGDRTLNRVEVTVYFKDAHGTIIAEEDFLPVLVSDYSFSGDNKPLKPGYVWQMERGKFYSAKSVPSEWEEGNAEAKVTDVEFAD